MRLLLVAVFLMTSLCVNAQITSDFTANVDGWTSPTAKAATFQYNTTGGNPTGNISGQTPNFINLGAGQIWFPFYFDAPAKFGGSLTAYYGGGLSYDVSQTSTADPIQWSAAIITNGAGISLYYYPNTLFAPPTDGSWQNFTIPLSAASSEWKTTDSSTGTAATAAQIQNVLANLVNVQIQGLYRNANLIGRIDNVALRPPLTVTTQPADATVCEGEIATFTGVGGNNPNITYQWQLFNPFSGYQSITNSAVYSGVTTSTLSVNTTGNVGAGQYRVRISGAGVPSVPSNAATLTINPLPTAPGATGAARCGTGSVTLTASVGLPGVYRWYTVATGGTPIAGATANTYTTPSLTTTTNYWVALYNGTCESTRTLAVATINNTAPPTTTDGSRCGNGTVVLTAAGGAAGQYRWYTVATLGTAIAGQTNATYTTPSLTGTTNYWVSIDNGTCESPRTIVTANVNPLPAAPGVTGGSGCNPSTVTLTATGGSAGQYRWYTVATLGTAIAGQTNATYTTPTLTTTTNYWVAINNGTCEGARTQVIATINNPPTAPGVTGGSGCNPSTVTLTATGGAAGQYRWYTVATLGTAIAGQTNATYTTPTLTTTTNYWVAINNGTCEGARTQVIATINNPPTAPGVTGGSGCNPSTVTLTATGGAAGQYRWYTVATLGTAIAGQTNATYTTPTLTTTTNYWVSIDNGTCESARTQVIATINNPPTAPGVTGGSGCNPSTVTLTATGGAAGQYRWYTVATLGTAIAGQTNATYTTPTLTTTTNYWVAINNGTCESARTQVIATINNPPTAPGVTGGSGCNPSTVTLTATGGAAGQYRWYTVATLGTAIAGQTNATYTTPTLTTTTNYWVSIDNGTCESARTQVIATINNPPTAPGVTGGSGCNPSTVVLTATGGAAGQYRWYTVATLGTAIAGQTNATYTTPTLTTTTNYWVSIDNGTCESARTQVIATINNPPTAPGVTGGSGCNPSTVTLTATGGAAGQYRWYTVATLGTAIAGQTNATYTTPTLTTTTNYWVAINNGTCESARTQVIATINNPPTAPGVTGGSGCNPSTVTLTATGGAAGQYRWYTVATLGTAIAGQTNATYATPTLATTTNYWVSINNGTCEGARTQVTATISNPPTAPGATGGSSCTAAAVTLTATGGAAGQYRWYTVATLGTAIAGQTNATYTTPVLSTTTNYWVSINTGPCEGPRTQVTASIGNPPTAPTVTGASGCAPASGSVSVTLSASGGTAGQYRWYTVATGGTAITGETNDTYVTPLLGTTTNYWVSVNNGCEGPRTQVTATINLIPTAPGTIGATGCVGQSLILNATGGLQGQYRWYTSQTGNTQIAGELNGSFTTPVLSASTDYWVSINNGFCESNRIRIVAAIFPCNNTAPVIETTIASTTVGGIVTINLKDLITDDDNNLDLSTLTIVSQPQSGASASIDANFNLVIDYSGKPFTGTESITISVCDQLKACSQQTLSIDVSASVNVYNALSPNNDGKNDVFYIDNIEKLPGTQKNKVLIFNRWGDLVWEGIDYNNTTVVFSGKSKNNVDLPTGTYFYKIEFASGQKSEHGYISLKR